MDTAARARREAAGESGGGVGLPSPHVPEAETPGSWPSSNEEPVHWERDPREPMSRRARRRSAGPYLASIPPDIADLPMPTIPDELLAEAGDAHAALARFDSTAGLVHAPLPSILLRTESSASSEVEQLTASAKQVALANIGDAKSANARLVVANVHAMESALALADRLDTDAVIEMHRALMERHDPSIVGEFRHVGVWVGGSSPHVAAHVAPIVARVPALMDDLMVYTRRTDLPVLPHIAIAHAQFESIHPFPDGNGRTGRALTQAMLRGSGTTSQVTVPVSAGLLANPQEYFDALTSYRRGDVVPIVRVFTDSTFRALENSRRLVDEINATQEAWRSRLDARRGSTARRALDILPAQPVVTIAHLAEQLEVSIPAASNAIATLTDAGILEQSTSGRRNRYWHAPEILNALDDFGRRARRGRG